MYFTDQVDRKMSIADSIDGPPFECGQFFFYLRLNCFNPPEARSCPCSAKPSAKNSRIV